MLKAANERVMHASRGAVGRRCSIAGTRLSWRPRITPLHLQTCAFRPSHCKAIHDNDKADAAATAAVEEQVYTPFFEPAVRSVVLGIGAGVILELLHVLTKFSSFATLTGAELSAVLPELAEELAPLIGWDNLAAMTSCALFYGIEVAAVMGVLSKSEDPKEQAMLLGNLRTLPKSLMPVNMSSMRRMLYTFMMRPSTAIATSLAFRDDSGASPAPRSSGAAGTAVLGRPPAPGTQTPPVGAPGGPMPRFPGDGASDSDPPANTSNDSDSTTTAAGGSTVLDCPAPAAPSSDKATQQPNKRRSLKDMGLAKQPRSPPSTAPAAEGSADSRTIMRPAPARPGAWDPTHALPMSRRAKELRDRRSYLKNFWYAACAAKDLVVGAPKEVKMLGRTVVLFRDEDGSVRCLDDVCPHRGAPLSKGWTKDVGGHTCVVCPYHGWAFDGQGKLREVPSSADQSHLPKRALVDTYCVEEKGGFVWLFFGSKAMPAAERPPIPYTPELDNPKWQPVFGEMEFDAPHWSVFDNALDMAHIHYLHSDSFGNDQKPVIHDMQVQRDTWGITGKFSIHNKPVNPLWEWTAVESVPVEYRAFLPSTSYVRIRLGAGVEMITFVNTVPIDANRAVNRFCLIRNFAGWEGFDIWAKNAMYKILSEDKVMVELLRPQELRTEVSLEADLPQVAFRKLRQEWVDMGYIANPEDTSNHDGSLDM